MRPRRGARTRAGRAGSNGYGEGRTERHAGPCTVVTEGGATRVHVEVREEPNWLTFDDVTDAAGNMTITETISQPGGDAVTDQYRAKSGRRRVAHGAHRKYQTSRDRHRVVGWDDVQWNGGRAGVRLGRPGWTAGRDDGGPSENAAADCGSRAA